MALSVLPAASRDWLCSRKCDVGLDAAAVVTKSTRLALIAAAGTPVGIHDDSSGGSVSKAQLINADVLLLSTDMNHRTAHGATAFTGGCGANMPPVLVGVGVFPPALH